MRPLWQILISLKERNQSDSLDCDECFQYMEHLAEEAIAGADKDVLQIAIKDHLSQCPDCQEHHQQRLDQMEEEMTAQKENS
ncbi:MAG: hypothetical protein JSV69_03315 [Chloroflexota bacterium]|nr:MAG: hypothetical protein JSV69_03315 [Chloroflexota bacterium]UCF26930.1 MAG: hypothetical protein JSW42_09775 [Chloroflexota bacterium]